MNFALYGAFNMYKCDEPTTIDEQDLECVTGKLSSCKHLN